MRRIVAGDLTLEPQTAAHADEMFVVLSDPAIYTWENRPPASQQSLRGRFTRLESRRSPDGSEEWLNWVIRLPSSQLAGYVQATVKPDGRALIAYELSSPHWGQGIARRAVEAMLEELQTRHGATTLLAIAKAPNARSIGLLRRLGFEDAQAAWRERYGVDADEVLMIREQARPLR